MQYKKYQCKFKEKTYIIEEDLPEVGWYFYVFDKSGKCIADYLQDSYKIIIEFAEENFQIPKENWKET
ncbi:MAG: hypothetical protein AB8G86_17875 [Saprospiraceae bacterium]